MRIVDRDGTMQRSSEAAEADGVIAVIDRLLAEVDDLTERVLDAVWTHVEGYQDTLAEKDELASVVHHSLTVVLGATAEQRIPERDDLADAERLGEARALQGFPVTSLVRSYRAAERCLTENFLREAIDLDGPTCARGVRALITALDKLEQAAIVAHRRTEQSVAIAHESTVAALLTRLVTGVGIDPVDLARQAAIIDIDPDRPYAGIAVVPSPSLPSTRVPNLRRQIARRLAEVRHEKVPSVIWQGLLLFLVADDAGGALATMLGRLAGDPPFGPKLAIGVGETAADLAGSGTSLRHAAAAAHHGSQHGLFGEVVDYADVALEATLAANHDTSRALVDHHLGALLDRPELLRTIRAFIDGDLSIRASAAALEIHPNTVSYRLKQIERLLGVDVRHVHDVTRIAVALHALDSLPGQRL